MSRAALTLRDVTSMDAPVLSEIWADVIRRPVPGQPAEDMDVVIARTLADPDDRIVVAECDGELAGAVFLRASTLSPLHLEPVVQVISPHVLPAHRRHGVGRALMEAAVAYAEERGIAHVVSASSSASRDAHRFLARLALAPHAVMRVAPTHLVRAKLNAQRPAACTGSRPLGQVLAARRSLRRQRDPV